MSNIRLLVRSDIESLLRLSGQAGWNQTEDDWRRWMTLEPEGCFGIESEGRVMASTTAACYGTRLAWIGMVLTDTAHRGRGYARLLMEHALGYLRRREIEWIKLDATDMGRPIYARLGFEDECAIERWRREPGRVERPSVDRGEIAEPPFDEGLDREAFGADRSALLRELARAGGAAVEGGFALFRPGANAAYFGPCVARDDRAVQALVGQFLVLHGGEAAFWDLLPDNTAAARLAAGHGFAPVRRLTRMALKGAPGARPLDVDTAAVFAIAGFEYG